MSDQSGYTKEEDEGFTSEDSPLDLEEDTLEDCPCLGHKHLHAKCTCSLDCDDPCELR